MLSRRDLLKNLTGGAVAIPLIGSAVATQLRDSAQNPTSDCSRPLNGPHAHYFPNVVVYTHEGRRALFYDDLLRGKTVMINCMSIKNDAVARVTKNLAKVQRLVQARLGRDLLMYSLTVDPEHDTPQMLKAFAQEHQTGAGWTFLTGELAVMELLRSRLFLGGTDHDHNHGGRAVEDCSLALIRYGNEAVGLWGSVPAKSTPESIVRRLSWIESGYPAAETFARGGPTPSLVESFTSHGRK